MIHCLGAIRGEFTKLAMDRARRFSYNFRKRHILSNLEIPLGTFLRLRPPIFKYMLMFDPYANVRHQDILYFAVSALEPLELDFGEP
ncbi:hypothetical protein GCG54_00015302 [Colletotrichum gloeosporioides]|uniref:Uncharacterized protein n=1 Tax=Colletotrichum gloeosporioides TaxID=474922 RepID=A0A8H4C837_COLGL|nr:uncharacterized protein GCG54_00015302 [Colletotrichum gloeosporioides]KAF3799121.1 hypothetical protein GCG54_00015302 [Colletotrichum gloeosporioides]